MSRKTKIISGIVIALALIGGVSYYFWPRPSDLDRYNSDPAFRAKVDQAVQEVYSDASTSDN